jgi:hypothetical protein
MIPAFRKWIEVLTAWLNARPQDMLIAMEDLAGLKILDDPEAIFLGGWMLCDAGALTEGFARIQRAVEKGFFVVTTLASAKQFAPLRGTPEFEALMRVAESGRQQALASFREGGGDRLLGLSRTSRGNDENPRPRA